MFTERKISAFLQIDDILQSYRFRAWKQVWMCLMFLNPNCLYSFRAVPFGKPFARWLACRYSAFTTADSGIMFPCFSFLQGKRPQYGSRLVFSALWVLLPWSTLRFDAWHDREWAECTTTSPVLIPVTLAGKETSVPWLKYWHLRILACEMQKAGWCLSLDDLKGDSKKLEKLHASVVAVARLSCASVRVSSRLEILTADPLIHAQEKRLKIVSIFLKKTDLNKWIDVYISDTNMYSF